jgi:hypothetical protein
MSLSFSSPPLGEALPFDVFGEQRRLLRIVALGLLRGLASFGEVHYANSRAVDVLYIGGI